MIYFADVSWILGSVVKNGIRLLACCGALLAAASTALADCAAPKLITPEGVTFDARPGIRWSATVGATAYAIKLQSRIPEGRLIASLDVVVSDTQFVPPTSLADEHAKVTVSITARCAGETSPSAQAWFLIDAAVNCASSANVLFKRENGVSVATWRTAPGAALYEVRLHAPLDGRVLQVLEAREPRAVLAGDLPIGAVVSVRPRCAQAFGEPALGVVPN